VRGNTEQTVNDVPNLGAVTHFWTMGSNLEQFPEFQGLCPAQLVKTPSVPDIPILQQAKAG
jgi:hypothetical protein